MRSLELVLPSLVIALLVLAWRLRKGFGVCVCTNSLLVRNIARHSREAGYTLIQGSAFCSKMGIFRGTFAFSLGAFAGVYIAQNYTIPNLKTFVTTGLIVARQLETQYRKPPNDDN